MVDTPSTCRLCGASDLTSLGVIPAGDYFAGRVLQTPIPGGCLWCCGGCGSLFRHPVLPSKTYRELYESGAPEQWSGDSGRQDLQVVRSVVLAHDAGGRVLDVGCGTGDFLASLPSTLPKFGIEPSVGAASEAKTRGIHIVARTLEELPADSRFDVITIIDVIEHMPDPASFLEQAYAHLSERGVIVVSTGNPENRLWRGVFRSRFWYSSFPEHVTFPSRQFYEKWASEKRSQVASVLPTRYRALPLWKSAVYVLIQFVYLVSPPLLNWVGRCVGMLSRRPRPRRQHFSPGVAGLFVDHWVVAIRRLP